jgi:hypothetical protein
MRHAGTGLGHGLRKAMTSFGSTDVCSIQHANAGGISRIAQHTVMVAFKFTLAELLAGMVSEHVQAAGERRGERPSKTLRSKEKSNR